MNKTSVDEILDYAIQAEQDAVDLYTGLAKTTKSPSARVAFKAFAAEEATHKKKLKTVKKGKTFLNSKQQVLDLKISDYTVAGELGDQPDYQEVLLFAMQQEKAAFKLYTHLANKTDVPEIKELLLGLAQEEAKHKLAFEIEYDENIYQEN